LFVTVVVFPATSVAVTVNVFGPTVAVLMFEPLATVPTQLATPEAGGAVPSEQLKLDVTDDLRIGVALLAGAVIATVGATESSAGSRHRREPLGTGCPLRPWRCS
jgi:hypothetical protein